MPWSSFKDQTLYVVGSGNNPAYQNSWVAYDTNDYYGASYYIDSDGFVHLQGLVKNGTIGESVAIFTLPVGFRPTVRILAPAVTNPNIIGRCDILTNGIVAATVGNNAWFSLGGISFKAA